jgi:galactokinase
VQYIYSPVRFERSIPLPQDLVFTIATSGIQAQKTGSAKAEYNRLSLQSLEVARLWREGTGSDLSDMGSILAADRDAVRRFADLLEHTGNVAFPIGQLRQRFEHFEQENQVIVPKAGTALAEGDFKQFGEWIDRSMHLAESLLGNQLPETCFLAARARQLGAVAASAFGAGFGGAVWALVTRDEAEKFKVHLKESYLETFPRHRESASFFLTDAGLPAMEIAPES